ncbi:hypothetical protein [Thermocrinis albus]|nr:hypothetical protein [Thermocrinis albus]
MAFVYNTYMGGQPIKGVEKLISKVEERFLGFVKLEGLRYLEGLLNVDLGSEKRKGRPFIGWYKNGCMFLVFLTTKRRAYKVFVNGCNKQELCQWIDEESYVFYDYRHRGYFVYKVKEDQLKWKEQIVFCGFCHPEATSAIDVLRSYYEGEDSCSH